jgi:hypothetical protein
MKKNLGQNILGMPGHIGAYPWRRRCSYPLVLHLDERSSSYLDYRHNTKREENERRKRDINLVAQK